MFVMLRRIFFTPLGVVLCRQWCLKTKTSWTMMLLVKRYPAINNYNQCMKMMNWKSGMSNWPCVKMSAEDCFKEPLKLFVQITVTLSHITCEANTTATTKEARIHPYTSKCKDYQCKHSPVKTEEACRL